MNANEIVRKIRTWRGHIRTPGLEPLVMSAADLIESLQAQITELRKECDIADAANTADRIAEITARCDEGRPIRRIDVKYLLSQLAERNQETRSAELSKRKYQEIIADLEDEIKSTVALRDSMYAEKDAEEQGLLVWLPCKAGERWMRDGKQYIVAEISITESCGTMVRHYEDGNGEMLSCNPQYFAKHYTRAEAEAALKGAEHDRV
jgi:predicted NACHT family NTPase